jgi:glyoxylase-like metal-dependent hydrolase (beta-lactamase superfamily II)
VSGSESGAAALARAAEAGIHVLRIPTPFAVGRVNAYLIEDDPLTLVDSGPNSGRALDELHHQLAEHGRSIDDIELIVLTHQHMDHLGLVDIIASHSGAEVAAIDKLSGFVEDFSAAAARDDEFATAVMLRNGISEDVVQALRQVSSAFRAWGGKAHVTRPLSDGDVLELGNRNLRVLHRPGHSPSDTVFWDAERHILIAADHLIKHISSNALITRPLDGSSERTQALVAYIDSLRKTRELPAEIVLSGHGEPITDHVGLIDERFALFERRAEKLYGLIAEEPRTGHGLAQALWGDVAVTQAFLTLSEVIGHVDLLINAGHVREVDDGDVIRYEATTDRSKDELGDLIPGGNPVRG